MTCGGHSAAEPPSKQVRRTKRRTFLPVVFAVALALAFTIPIAYWLDYDREGYFAHDYYVKVEATNLEEYVIRLPVPSDANGLYPQAFVDDIRVLHGNATLALGVFGHGLGLEITGGGDLELEWAKSWPKSSNVRYGNLTMTIGAEGWEPSSPEHRIYSWIFSNRSDIRVQFLYTSIHHYMASPRWASGGGPTYGFIEHPNGEGWQAMPLDYGWMVIN